MLLLATSSSGKAQKLPVSQLQEQVPALSNLKTLKPAEASYAVA